MRRAIKGPNVDKFIEKARTAEQRAQEFEGERLTTGKIMEGREIVRQNSYPLEKSTVLLRAGSHKNTRGKKKQKTTPPEEDRTPSRRRPEMWRREKGTDLTLERESPYLAPKRK